MSRRRSRDPAGASCLVVFVFDSMTPAVALQAPLSLGFPRQGCWSGWPFPSPWDLPNPGIKHASPALQADSLLSEPPGKQNPVKKSKCRPAAAGVLSPWRASLKGLA